MSCSCPVCGKEKMRVFFSIEKIPVIINILSNTRDEAINLPTGDLNLGFCDNCGHVYNTSFDESLLDYSGEYDNSLHFSPTFQEFADNLSKSLIEECGLHRKNIIEVGCGKADFLELLCSQGGSQGIGYDPSIEDDNWKNVGENGGAIKLVRGFFTEDCKHVPGDIILCQHVLEHIGDPEKFVLGIAASRSKLNSHHVYYEVPNVLYTLRDKGIWDLIYEHCSYFTPQSLAYLMSHCGYEAQACKEVYGRQFLSFIGRTSITETDEPANKVDISYVKKLIEEFKSDFDSKVKSWKELINSSKATGYKTVVWGAGSKGITFLNMLARDSGIEYIIDLNPAKLNKFVAGSGQQIKSPEFLSTYQPDQVIIMNPLYQKEIVAMLAEQGLLPEVFIA